MGTLWEVPKLQFNGHDQIKVEKKKPSVCGLGGVINVRVGYLSQKQTKSQAFRRAMLTKLA